MSSAVSRFTLALVAAGTALCASAQTPKQAICALQQTVACPNAEACERALPGAANLPSLMRFELDNAVVESRLDSGEIRTSKIASSSTHDDAVVMQGDDGGRPWAMRVNTKTGRFTLTVALADEAIVGFGVCSAKILK